MKYESSYQIRDGESPAEAVVAAVAAVADPDPTELPPLYDTVDADALNALLADDRGAVDVSFGYYGYRVTVSSADVVVTPVE